MSITETTYHNSFYYLNLLIMGLLKKFFAEYPECEMLGFKWEGDPRGNASSDSEVYIWNEYPVHESHFPAIVVQIDATPLQTGLGSGAQMVGESATVLEDGRTAYGSYKGMFLRGVIRHSIVSLRKTDHQTLSSLLMNHYNHVIWNMLEENGISCRQVVKNVKYSDNKFLASQRVYMTQFDVEFQTTMREFIPIEYNHYLVSLDTNNDGILEKFYIENHYDKVRRKNSVAYYNSTAKEWQEATSEEARLVATELDKQLANGSADLIEIGYIAQERTLNHDSVITAEGGHILDETVVPLHSKVETTHLDDRNKIPKEN